MLRQLDKCDPSRDRCPANRADQPNFQVVVDKQALRSFNGVEPNLFGYRHAPTPGCQPRPSLRRRGEGAATYTLQEKVGSGSWATAYSGTAQSKAYSGKASGSYGYRIRACNPAGCTGYSATQTVQSVPVPTARKHVGTGNSVDISVTRGGRLIIKNK